MKIIGIAGKKQSGKDTCTNYIIEKIDHVYTYSFSTPIYNMIRNLIGDLPLTANGDVDKLAIIKPYNVTLRHMLQTLGTEWGRHNIHPNIWVMHAAYWLENVDKQEHQPTHCVFTDVRFANEVEWVKLIGGTIVQIQRDACEEDNHSSENGVHPNSIDCVIHNNGSLAYFYSSIQEILDEL